MLVAWRSLTHRGRFFLVAGLGVLGVALAWGQHDIAWLGLLLVVLPLAALLVLRRTRVRLECRRTVTPSRVPIGERMVATLRLGKSGALPIGLLQFEDSVPAQLGRRPRFSAHRVTGAWERELTYPLMGLARGRHRVGPLTVRAADPFGMASITNTFRDVTEVLVTPRVFPLPAMADAGGASASGDSSPQRIGRLGQDDVLVREYHQGDDVRRVHWRSTARWNQLMVRREEQAWEPAVTVLLDNRASRHAGSGRTSSFEWAVSAAASVADHFAANGFRVSLVDADGLVLGGGTQDPATTRQACLLALADETPSSASDLAAAVAAAHGAREGELVVAVLAALTPDDLVALGGIRRGHSQGLAVLLDPRGFGRLPELPLATDARARLRDQRWRVAEAGSETSVPGAWGALATGSAA